MKNHRFVLFTVIVLCISILYTGCYTYFPTTKEDLLNKKSENKVKIILNNNEELFVENISKVDFSNHDEIVAFQIDSTKVKFSLKDVEKISEERFDFGKTFFSSLWISLGAAMLYFGILILSDAELASHVLGEL